ncbi:MAG: ribonuclease M5 [Streptococcaceae bacterium]|jgi:ribonuclease M5|nr:ribonuclease M5 [Streptococcaceae bacterium]
MKRERIEEIIVVEGKSDTKRLQEVLDVVTIETNGSAIDDEILQQIEHAERVRGVIIFTDPDFSGEKIRKMIMQHVPTAKHAFLPRSKAKPKSRTKGRSLGVEHASNVEIISAIQSVSTPIVDPTYEEIPRALLVEYGLLAGKNSKQRREKLGDELRIGYTNGKQLVKRLKMFRIERDEFLKVANQLFQGDDYDV